MNENLPSQVLAPLEFRRAGTSVRFAVYTGGPITAVDVVSGDSRIGWLWFSDADAAAGWITDHNVDITEPSPAPTVGEVGAAWTRMFEALAVAGHAPSTVQRLPEEAAGSVGTPMWENAYASTLKDLWAVAGFVRSDLPSVANLALEALGGGRVSGAALDAVLRGQFPVSDAMLEQIHAMDQALEHKPVPERLVVSRGTSLGAWLGEPEALVGERLVENAYLATRIGPIEPEGIDAVVHFAVPAGVPALYTAPPDQPERGMLILRRLLEWNVVGIHRAESGTWVISADIVWPPTPAPTTHGE
ncbi:hypothetical protein [Demequina aurantiaca]|uniref:hypothetical protein n=1 Tax=Demequina aurantiaca TaxID=676200 RepID=UPI003D332415